MGQVAVGLLAVGQVGAGLLAAVGQVAFAWHSIAQFAAGVGRVYGQIAAGPEARGALDWTGPASIGVVVAAWACCAAALTALGRAHRRGLARLLPVDVTAIRDTAPGHVLLRGRVVPMRTIDGPVSGRACVAYDMRRGSPGRIPRVERVCEDFVLDDGSGRAHVIAADVELVLEPGRAAQRVLASAHAAPRSTRQRVHTSPPTEICLERALLPGEEVLIAATAMRSVAGAAAQSGGGARVIAGGYLRPQIVLHGGAAGPVLVTNREPRELRAEARLGLLVAGVMWCFALLAPLA